MPSLPRVSLRVAGAWGLAAAVALGGFLGAVPVAAASAAATGVRVGSPEAAAQPVERQTEQQADSEDSDAATPSADLVIAPQDTVLEPGTSDVQFSVLVRNTGDVDLPAGQLSLVIGSRPLADLDALTELDDESPGVAMAIGAAEIGATAAGEEQTATIAVARSELPLTASSDAGVYRVQGTLTFAATPASGPAEFDDDDPESPGDLIATTPLVWRGAGEATVPTSLIVPFVLPSDIRTLPTRQQLDELSRNWDRLLTAARSHRATLAIDPRIIAGIRAYGDDAPRSAQLLLGRLESTALPSFLLQFADADPAAQAALGFTSLLEPTSLDFVSRFGTFPDVSTDISGDSSGQSSDATGSDSGTNTPAPSSTPSPSPNPAQDAGDEANADADEANSPVDADEPDVALPKLTELLEWPAETAATAWPAGGRADSETLELLERSGIRQLVLSSDAVTRTGGPRAALGDAEATVTDAGLDAAARRALAGASETERSAGLADLAARLVIEAQSGSTGVVIGLDRGAVGDAADPATLLDALDRFTWATPTAVSDQPVGSARLDESGPSEDRLELLRSAANREASVAEVGAVLVHPEYLSGYQRTRLLELFATRYADPDVDFADMAAAFRARDAELLDGVQAISTEHIQLVGSSTRVPVQIKNALPFDAVVTVQVDPASAALSVSERRFADVLVSAEANERVLVPVRSRVSSGESGLVVGISTVDGTHTVFTGTLSITIRSSVETIAFWVLGVLASALLGFGIWRSIRRRRARRDRQGDPAPTPTVDASAHSEAAGIPRT